MEDLPFLSQESKINKTHNQELVSRIVNGPSLLFLGQEYLKWKSDFDIFLKAVADKFQPELKQELDYNLFWKVGAKPEIDINSVLLWMNKLTSKLNGPQGLEIISRVPWSSVYTSCIDNTIQNLLKNDWRRILPVFSDRNFVKEPRNQIELHLTYLFGCVSQIEKNERPPFSLIEKISRDQVASNLLQRIPEIITPEGVVVIDCYNVENDWLNAERLYPTLAKLGKGQVLWFGFDSNSNAFVNDLKEKGIALISHESLYDVLIKEVEIFDSELKPVSSYDSYGRWVSIKDKKIKVPPDLWNSISKSATPIDDFLLGRNESVEYNDDYVEFRNFLASSSISPNWKGYRKKFAFRRTYQKELEKIYKSKFVSQDILEEPIILFGQAGSGKTMSVGMLAYDIVDTLKQPVLFVQKGYRNPNEADIDKYCEWCESNGAIRTTIVWDGDLESSSYYNLLKSLNARGRKVILVGTCYNIKDENNLASEGSRIVVPIDLEEEEKDRFLDYIKANAGEVGVIDKMLKETDSKHFLSLLYRYLPSTQRTITMGLSDELDYFSNWIIANVEKQPQPSNPSVMSELLLKAGIISEDDLKLTMSDVDIDGETITLPQFLSYLIIIPGQFGLSVPFDLLIRCLGSKAFSTNLFHEMRKADVFRWYEDQGGNIYCGARNAFEAKILVKTLGTKKAQVEYIKTLLSELRYSSFSTYDYDSGSEEIQFAIELLMQIGPNSVFKVDINLLYEIALTLRNLRETKQAYHPRLVLQEASYLREISKNWNNNIKESPKDLLEISEFILRQELDSLGQNNGTKTKIYTFLQVELASVMGTKMRETGDEVSHEQKIQMYEDLKHHVLQARSISPENYPAIDVFCWATLDLLKFQSDISELEKMEVIADLYHLIDLTDLEGTSVRHRIKFEERKLQIGDALKNNTLSDESFDKLLKEGSGAGIYIRAIAMAGNLQRDYDKELPTEDMQAIERALNYLNSNLPHIVNDARSNYLLLRLWWLKKVKKPLFFQEKQLLAFDENDWIFVLRLVDKILTFQEQHLTASLLFLKAIALFHLDDIKGSLKAFEYLDDITDFSAAFGRRRIVKSYIASNPDGTPRKYSGQIRYSLTREAHNNGELYVADIQQYIKLNLGDFRLTEVKKDDRIDGFYIAFNFRGLIAMPPGSL